jgi:hypothetical protein
MGSTSFVPRAPGCENAAFVVERLEFACGLSAAFVAASRDDPSLNETAFVLSDGRAASENIMYATAANAPTRASITTIEIGLIAIAFNS